MIHLKYLQYNEDNYQVKIVDLIKPTSCTLKHRSLKQDNVVQE